MQKPLGAGDICIVIEGLGGKSSPNIGKLVTIDKRVYGEFGMDHRKYGAIFSCIGKDLSVLKDNGTYELTSKCDIPGIWLKRIDPKELSKETTKILEVQE